MKFFPENFSIFFLNYYFQRNSKRFLYACFAIFLILIFSSNNIFSGAKDDILFFLSSTNSYCQGKDIRSLPKGQKCDIRYSPSELAIKKAIDALSKISDTEVILLEGQKYSKEKIHSFIVSVISEKFKHYDELYKMLNDSKLVSDESSQKEDAERFLSKVKMFKEKKGSTSSIVNDSYNLASVGAGTGLGVKRGDQAGQNAFDLLATEFEVIKAIAATKYLKAAEKADLKKAVEYAIKEKQQVLRDLETIFKKMPVPQAVRSTSGNGFGPSGVGLK